MSPTITRTLAVPGWVTQYRIIASDWSTIVIR